MNKKFEDCIDARLDLKQYESFSDSVEACEILDLGTAANVSKLYYKWTAIALVQEVQQERGDKAAYEKCRSRVVACWPRIA